MNLVVVGLNHRSAPVEVREGAAIARTGLGETCQALRATTRFHETVILSTCNRVEIYGLADSPADGTALARRFLHEHHRLAAGLDPYLYEHRDADCVRHLLEVACGLDSMVLGETEILGQVKEAYLAAHAAGATGLALNRLFQKTLAAAKQVRSTTAIGRGSTSVSSVAVDLAEKIFRNLDHCAAMVLGTGAMSEATARVLRGRGAGEILVCSRSRERAETLAVQLDGRAIAYEEWPREFPAVDIVISSTAAPHPILTRDKLVPLMRERRNRPLFLIDIAVPRDIERACGELADVYLYDIDDLQQIAQGNVLAREQVAVECRQMIAGHLGRFLEWFAHNRAALDQRYGPAPDAAAVPRPAPTS